MPWRQSVRYYLAIDVDIGFCRGLRRGATGIRIGEHGEHGERYTALNMNAVRDEYAIRVRRLGWRTFVASYRYQTRRTSPFAQATCMHCSGSLVMPSTSPKMSGSGQRFSRFREEIAKSTVESKNHEFRGLSTQWLPLFQLYRHLVELRCTASQMTCDFETRYPTYSGD